MKNFEDSQFYFNHGYFYNGKDEFVCAKSSFHSNFPSIIKRDNILGFQFHPEKSQDDGLNLIEHSIQYLMKN